MFPILYSCSVLPTPLTHLFLSPSSFPSVCSTLLFVSRFSPLFLFFFSLSTSFLYFYFPPLLPFLLFTYSYSYLTYHSSLPPPLPLSIPSFLSSLTPSLLHPSLSLNPSRSPLSLSHPSLPPLYPMTVHSPLPSSGCHISCG